MKILKLKGIKLIVFFVGIAVIVSLIGSIVSVWKKQDIVGERSAVLRRVEAQNQLLKKQLEEALTPAFVERAARDKLGLVKPGETIVFLEKPQASRSVSLTEQGEESVHWKQWWKLFF